MSDSVELWEKTYEQNADDWFPEYYVSQPPHRDNLEPVYYKVVSPDGPVFWRNEDDEKGKETSFYSFFMEGQEGFGLQRVDKQYTPWGDG